MQVGRATSIKDIFDFVIPPKLSTSLKPSHYEKMNTFETEDIEGSMNPFKEVKQETTTSESKEEIPKLSPTEIEETMPSASTRTPVFKDLKRKIKNDDPESLPYMMPSTSRQFLSSQHQRPVVSSQRQLVNSRISVSPGYSHVSQDNNDNSQDAGTDRQRIDMPSLTRQHAIPEPNPRDAIVSSQTLKRHNISFERRTK